MRALAQGCQEAPDLRFLIDEVAFADGSGKVVCDLIAVRWQPGGVHTVLAIELKSGRELTRLIAQVESSASFIERHRSGFAALAKASWNEPIRLAPRVERWIVWPTNAAGLMGDQDPHAEACAEKQIRLVTYSGSGSAFRLSAASPVR